MNLVISAVIWAIIIGLMSVDWAELGKLILIGGGNSQRSLFDFLTDIGFDSTYQANE